MRNMLIAAGAGVAILAALPSLASAETYCQRQRDNNATAGTVIGAIGGALVGSAVAGRHDRGVGAVVGGLGGAVAGNVIGRSSTDCPPGYVAYDDSYPPPAYNNGYYGNGYYNNGYYGNGYYNNGYYNNGYGYNNGYNSGYYNGYNSYDNSYADRDDEDDYDRTQSYHDYADTWQDAYGRTCRWEDQGYRDAYGRWVSRQTQVCR